MEPLFDVNRLMEVMSEILSDKYGCKITMRAIPKQQTEESKENASGPRGG